MTLFRPLGLGVALVAVAAAAAEDGKPAKLDPAQLVGTWKLVGGVNKDGDKMPDEKLKGAVEFTKDTIALKADQDFAFKYTLDPATTPAGIDLEVTAPDTFKGAKAKGIVSLDKDRLKLSYNPAPDGGRPKDFDAKKGSGAFAFTLEKPKKKE